MTKKLKAITTHYYVETCLECGNDFRVQKYDKETVCYDCRTKKRIDEVNKEGQFLIGAVIVGFEPHNCGTSTSLDELDSILVQTVDKQMIKFTGGGYEERYIEWENVRE